MKKKIKKIIRSNSTNTVIIILSVLAVVIGGLAFDFIKALLLVSLINLLFFGLSYYINRKTRKKPIKRKSKKSKSKGKVLKIIIITVFVFAIIGLTGIAGFFFYIVKNAPEFKPENLYTKEASILYDANGEVYAKIGMKVRTNTTYDKLPEVLIDAIIATEDSRFFQHNGFDLPRFLIASSKQALGNSGAGGASTITMQISKNNFTNDDAEGIQGIVRKFTDIYMSMFIIEKNYTKEEILEFYVNTYYLGGGAWGVEQAAQTFFNKSVSDINLAEAALIAGLYQAPFKLDPTRNPEGAEKRRQTVLYLMERHGYISKEEKEIALQLSTEKLLSNRKNREEFNEYQGFIDTVVAEIRDKTGNDPYNVPMAVYTTLDPKKQDYINSVLKGEKFKWENDDVQTGISIIDVKTGAIAAIGTGRNRTDAKSFNLATESKKQIGSTAKPLYEYAPGIEYNNWSTYTPFVDEAYTYSNKTPISNWDGKYMGLLTLRESLRLSRNIPALKAFQKNDNKNIKNFVTGLGLTPEIESNKIHEAHSIGGYTGESPLSLSAAYASFANGGYYVKPYSFTKITYLENGKTYEQKVTKNRAMSEETAYMITDILLDTSSYALGSYSKVNNVKYAAKTGTTNFDSATKKALKLPSKAVNDYWVAGFTPDYSIAIWYGYEKNYDEKTKKTYYNTMGSSQHKKLFQAVAKGFFTKDSSFTKPQGVVEIALESGSPTPLLASEYTPKDLIVYELFKTGTEPTEVSPRFTQLNNVSNVNYSVNSNTITINWEPIKTPDYIDTGFLTNYYKKIYQLESNQTKYLNERIKYNNNNIGTITYDIYIKNGDGSLELVGTTPSNSINQTIYSKASPITYIIKTSYSKYKSNASNGAEITVSFDTSDTIITSELNGQSIIEKTIGEAYIEPVPSVIVLENLINVTSSSNITKVITKSDGTIIETIPSDISGIYTITYNIKYGSYINTLTRTIKYQ